MFLDANWPQRGLEALQSTLDVDTRTRNQMIEFLQSEGFWDASKLSWDGAVARWNDNLNPTKASFFKIGELWALMKRFNRHQLFVALAEDLGYEVRLRPNDERRQALMERMANALEQFDATISAARTELAQLSSAEHERVTTTRAGAPARFSFDDEGSRGF